MRCPGWKARPCLNAWKAAKVVADACDKESVEALRLRQKMVTQILANVEEEWMTSMEKEE